MWHRILGTALIGVCVTVPRAVALTDVAVSFEVQNTNESAVPCGSDGASYPISGRLVAPDDTPSSVSLVLHGLGFGQWFWSFPGMDFAAALAGEGHALVVIDRLGYDGSGKPHGFASCLGAQATIARQIADQLREGSYTRNDTGSAPVFEEVALVGHSAGGATAQIAAYSFPEAFDALAVVSYADQGASDLALTAFGGTAIDCGTVGTDPAGENPAGGYAPFGRTDEDFQALMFHDADPDVVSAATSMRNLDPCGDSGSIPTEIVVSNLQLSSIDLPVLVLCGNDDAIFPPPACEEQKDHFTGTADVTLERVDSLGHAVTLERNAGVARERLSAWLTAKGF